MKTVRIILVLCVVGALMHGMVAVAGSLVVASHEYNPLVTSSFSVTAGQSHDGPILYDNKQAQIFVAERSGVVDEVLLAISLPDPVNATLRVRIMSVSNGLPDTALAEDYIHYSVVPALPAGLPYFNVAADFEGSDALLLSGQEYAVVFDSLTHEADYRLWGSTSYLYDGGSRFETEGTNAWVAAAGDFYFRVTANPAPGVERFKAKKNDFDGDGIADICCFDPATARWYVMLATNSFYTRDVGIPGGIPLTGDFDADGRADIGCYTDDGAGWGVPGTWILSVQGQDDIYDLFGYVGTVPVVGDFDGDLVEDYGCYDAAGRQGQPPGSWYFMTSSNGFFTATFGYDGTVPVVGDFDGDGVDDYGCYDAAGRYGQPPGSWYFMSSSNGFFTARFGYDGTVPVVGDVDGDGVTDYGCYDAAGAFGQPPGSWYFMPSSNRFFTATFGYVGTVPVVGDYDGDGTDDYGCYDDTGIPGLVDPGTWYIMRSRDGFITRRFGYAGTIPLGPTPPIE